MSRASHASRQEIEHARGERFVLQQIVGGEQLLAEAADGEHRADQRQRRNHGADARAIAQARVDDGRRIVDAAADVRHDAVDDHAQVRLILEADVGFDQLAGALDVDVVEAVHHDVADGGVFEQRLQRAQAEDFVEHFFDEALALGDGHRDLVFVDQPLHHVADLVAHAFFAERFELLRRERVDQLRVDPGFDLEPAVGSAGGAVEVVRDPMVYADAFYAVLARLPLSRRSLCRQRRGRRGPDRRPPADRPRTDVRDSPRPARRATTGTP